MPPRLPLVKTEGPAIEKRSKYQVRRRPWKAKVGESVDRRTQRAPGRTSWSTVLWLLRASLGEAGRTQGVCLQNLGVKDEVLGSYCC